MYCDAGAGEAIQLNVGLQALLGLGVAHICELETASARDAIACQLLVGQVPTRLVIVATQLLTDLHLAILRAIKVHPQASSCLILSAVSAAAHTSQPSTMLGPDAFGEYQAALQEDLSEVRAREEGPAGAGSIDIQVRYFALQACVLDGGAFVLPASSAAATAPRIGGSAAGWATASGRHQADQELDAAESVGLQLLAHALVSFAADLNLRVDTFTVGPASHRLGEELCALPVPDGPTGGPPTETASLVLVDRSLDLVTPASHPDHLLDQIFGSLPRRPSGRRTSQTDTLTADRQSRQWMEFLISRQGKDAALFLRKWLREGVRKEGMQTKMRFKTGAASPAELQALAELLAASPQAVLNQGTIMQIGFAAAAALQGAGAEKWDMLAKQEKQLLLLSGEGTASIASELQDLVRVASTAQAAADLTLRDVLLLAVTGYSLAGEMALVGEVAEGASPFPPADERNFKDALISAILNGNPSKQPKAGDHNTVIMFVVGGIGVTELREVRQEIEEKQAAGIGAGMKFIVGGTSLLAPQDVAGHLLLS
ncbi:hypothetical protein WJX72_007414 [[Myrmecia] bisecta]|uniref:Sec1-like protein n=1 Tax=[Myrmecia] bisecta TaxID=41462 RepID=A0AAW1R7B5_9CHLO